MTRPYTRHPQLYRRQQVKCPFCESTDVKTIYRCQLSDKYQCICNWCMRRFESPTPPSDQRRLTPTPP